MLPPAEVISCNDERIPSKDESQPYISAAWRCIVPELHHEPWFPALVQPGGNSRKGGLSHGACQVFDRDNCSLS